MPLIYGEGSKAFLRLQRENLKTSGDQSVFAWNFVNEQISDFEASGKRWRVGPSLSTGMFAHHPIQFRDCRFITFHRTHSTEIRDFNGFLKLTIPLVKRDASSDRLGLLLCSDVRRPEWFIGMHLLQSSIKSLVFISARNMLPR